MHDEDASIQDDSDESSLDFHDAQKGPLQKPWEAEEETKAECEASWLGSVLREVFTEHPNQLDLAG